MRAIQRRMHQFSGKRILGRRMLSSLLRQFGRLTTQKRTREPHARDEKKKHPAHGSKITARDGVSRSP